MRARGRSRHGWKSTECCEPAVCVVSKRDISLHNIQRNIWKIQDGGCWHFRFVAFVTILLNRPHRSRRFIYFKALFSCKKHQGKIYKTQRVLVANLTTNFWILVTSTIILVALATVLGAISCPVLATKVLDTVVKWGNFHPQNNWHSSRLPSTQSCSVFTVVCYRQLEQWQGVGEGNSMSAKHQIGPLRQTISSNFVANWSRAEEVSMKVTVMIID